MDANTLNGLMVGQVVVCVLLVVSILLQNRAEGLGKMFGGGGEVFVRREVLSDFFTTSRSF